ncbi:hypothetical protein OC842_000426 [Tilletia horrida]|uniref:Uncharacterized protein n=1 Tax=Tilletia horrida TaxID=155126 RepID=A0AAN6GH17_9BASI|nr:hypothetical protein OC842_000426 [Tilletia horrida]
MSNANTYTTFAEAFIQMPVIEIEDVKNHANKDGFVSIKTMAKTKDGPAVDAIAGGYWRGDVPCTNSLVLGWTFAAVTKAGLEFFFERDHVETRPGDVEDDSYYDMHQMQVPAHFRVFGKVVASTSRYAEVEIVTYLISGKVTFRARLIFENGAGPIFRVGSFAGGFGVLTGFEAASAKSLGILTLAMVSYHAGVAHTGSAYGGGKNHSKWASRMGGKGTQADLAPKKSSKDTELGPITTYVETAGRFLLCDVVDPEHRAVTIRAVTTEGYAVDFDMQWPLETIPPVNTVFGMHAQLVLHEHAARAIPIPNTVEVRPGAPTDDNYRDDQLLAQAFRVRYCARITESSSEEFTGESIVAIEGHVVRVNTRALVPSTTRWQNFKALALHQVISARGTVSGVVFGENAMFLIDMEHLQNAAVGTPAALVTLASPAVAGPSTPQTPPNLGTPQDRIKAAWDSPTRRCQLMQAGGSGSSSAQDNAIGSARHASGESLRFPTLGQNGGFRGGDISVLGPRVIVGNASGAARFGGVPGLGINHGSGLFNGGQGSHAAGQELQSAPSPVGSASAPAGAGPPMTGATPSSASASSAFGSGGIYTPTPFSPRWNGTPASSTASSPTGVAEATDLPSSTAAGAGSPAGSAQELEKGKRREREGEDDTLEQESRRVTRARGL